MGPVSRGSRCSSAKALTAAVRCGHTQCNPYNQSKAVVAALFAMLSGWGGLLLSYHANLPSGPAIVLLAGAVYLVSLAAGTRDSLLSRALALRAHRVA